MPDTSRAAQLRRGLTLCCLLVATLALFPATTACAQQQEQSFSKNKEADALMREGESFFAAKSWDKAQEAYEKALKLDPMIYEAPLFIGDVYFQRGEMDKAGEWYAKAIAIDPNRETAYRYWSDACLLDGKMLESRDKAIEAIIAEPFNRMAYIALTQWAEKNSVQLAHPKIEIPAGISSSKPGEVNITLDPKLLSGKEDGSGAWIVYSITRANWRTQKFSKTFPKEKAYRHSLAEEVDALRMVIKSVKANKKVKKLDESLANLMKVNNARLLEAYILLARADDGIAQDYEQYRKANRKKLRRYLTDFVAGAFKQQGKI